MTGKEWERDKMEFVKVRFEGSKLFYWTWRDLPFLPYAWLNEDDLEKLPRPFFLSEIHPDCPIGFETKYKDEHTNIIKLSDSFEKLKLDKDLRKDLKRVEKKNSDLRIVMNEKNALDKSKRWFIELWKEDKRDFERRLKLWKKRCYTLSAYLNDELIAVHIAMKEKDVVYYLGCWWNREYKNRSVAIFLLKRDIERAIIDRIKYYDLGIGDESYKKEWGIIERPTKYYAIVTKEIAKLLGIDRYEEMSNKAVR